MAFAAADRSDCASVLVDAEKLALFYSEIGRVASIGMEACATAHQWARELKKLGHDVRLMPPTYVKAYVKRGKNRCCRRGRDL